MRESKIERYLIEQVKQRGGLCRKFKSPARRNVPDQLVFLLTGLLILVECKAPGEKPKRAQLREHARYRARGFRVEVADTIEAVDRLLSAF